MSGPFFKGGLGQKAPPPVTLEVEGTAPAATPSPVKEGKDSKEAAPKFLSYADRIKVLVDLGKSMDKDFGSPNTLLRLGDRAGLPVPSRPTNLVSMDQWVFGCGGVPKGRIIEIFGPESAGKTTITLDILAQVQAAGGLGAFVDAEHALDPHYASILGVNVKDLFISQPDYGEQALQVVERLVESRAVDVIVVDSVAALVPKAELEGEIGDSNVGLHARLMSQAMRILTAKVNKTGVTVIFINQIREKIGVMFGNPETTTGGRALKFFSSVRLDVRKTKMIGEGGKVKEYGKGDNSAPIGHVIKVKAVKNKVGIPLRETELHHLYETGIDRTYDLMNFADKQGIFSKRGSWIDLKTLVWDEDKKEHVEKVITLGNGVASATEYVKSHPEVVETIKNKVWVKLHPDAEEAV